MTKEDLVREWLDLARQDKASADFLGSMRPNLKEIICFHHQQAAEKALKAVLQSRDAEIPRTHDLLALNERVRRTVRELLPIEVECNELNDYAVTVRYPMRIEITDPDAASARKAAERR